MTISTFSRLLRRMGRIRLKYLLPTLVLGYLALDYMGAFTHYRELDYYTQFTYPLEGDLDSWVASMKRGERAAVDPVNPHPYRMLKTAGEKCVEGDGVHYVSLRVAVVVKSAAANFERRAAIRQTWGFERRFSDVPVRTVFLVGLPGNDAAPDVSARLEMEHGAHGDLVQGDFLDAYYNNTMKAMMGLRWATEVCPTSRFYLFVDDDYYVSARNLLRFLRNPVGYPGYLDEPVLSFDDPPEHERKGRKLQQLVDFDLPEDARLFAGHVFHTPPLRHKTSKWYVSLEEYPYHLWPPYVSAGAYVLSRPALVDLYYASYFVKKFRFDDVYLGLVAKKVGLEPFHSGEFLYYPREPRTPATYRHAVASHGFGDPDAMKLFWSKQKEAGNA